MKSVHLLFVFFASLGCRPISEFVDYRTFVSFGGTLFSSPQTVSMKELHLDSGTLLGKDVVIEGEIVSRAAEDTHVVMADESARMMVVLAKIPQADKMLKDDKIQYLRVLGTVERGKKGLPFVMARVIASGEVPRKQ